MTDSTTPALAAPHIHAAHPAVGLLDCVRGVGGKKFTRVNKEADQCVYCGFDEAWHQLKTSDHTGVRDQDKYWSSIHAQVLASPRILFVEAQPQEQVALRSSIETEALRGELSQILAKAQADAKAIRDQAELDAKAQVENARLTANAIAQAVAEQVKAALAAQGLTPPTVPGKVITPPPPSS